MIGNAAMVLHRSVIRTGAIVAANSVVLADVDVPEGALAAGSPAVIKPGRARPDEIKYAARDVRGADRGVPHRTSSIGLRVRAFVVVVAGAEVELAADALWQLGVRAIEERTPPPTAGVTDDRVELWTSVGDEEDVVDRAVASLSGRWPHRIVERRRYAGADVA